MSGRSAVRGALVAAVLGLGLLASSGVAAAGSGNRDFSVDPDSVRITSTDPDNRDYSVDPDSVRITSDGDIIYSNGDIIYSAQPPSTDWTAGPASTDWT